MDPKGKNGHNKFKIIVVSDAKTLQKMDMTKKWTQQKGKKVDMTK